MSIQLTLATANQTFTDGSWTSKEQIRRSWAFAVDTSVQKRRRKTLRDINRCVITAVSREAKALGVRAGMAAADARLIMPELRVFVCNWR